MPKVGQVARPPSTADIPQARSGWERQAADTIAQEVVVPYGAAVAVRDSYAAGSRIGPALASGDYKGAGAAFLEMTASAFGALPAVPSFAGVIAGAKASTADRAALKRAQEMEAAGKSREEIWSTAAWFRGPDGQWRHEIDDSKAGLMGGTEAEIAAKGASEPGYLGMQVAHKELFDAYPDLRMVTARFGEHDRKVGQYSADKGLAGDIKAAGPTADSRRSTALHEIQHAIQEQEGFDRGSSPQQFSRSDDPFRDYKRAGGEAEARMVEARRNLTPEQRAARGPWLDYDVPEADMIIRRTPAERASSALDALANPAMWGPPRLQYDRPPEATGPATGVSTYPGTPDNPDDVAYGTGMERFTRGGMKAVENGRDLTTAEVVGDPARGQLVATKDRKVGDANARAIVAGNRAAIVGIGLDPRNTSSYDVGKSRVEGVTDTATGRMAVGRDRPVTVAHEAIHNGVQRLIKAGELEGAAGMVSKTAKGGELITRMLMLRHFGEAEAAQAGFTHVQIDMARELMSDPGFVEMLDDIDRAAERHAAKRRPGGPR